MKKGYWIILVFALWCVVCALWYMFSVKKLPNTAEIAIVPAPTIQAIIEILIMISVAFFMGFGLAWLMRSHPLEEATTQLRNTTFEIRELETTVTIQKESIGVWERQVAIADELASNATKATEQLNQKIAELTAAEESARRKSRELESKLNQLEGEHNSAKFRIRLLENEIDEKAKTVGILTEELHEVETKPVVEHRDWSDHPFVRPVEGESDNRDDLTQIKGIGPAFQKKLNSLDIFTFRQISELDGEGVERLAEIIEVFPERIHRDNWIGQATRLYQKKMGTDS
jgi:predicted flap endonuclease-1-like 5' DNA nuclease